MALISAPLALRRFAEADPQRPALTVDGKTLTRAELESRTNRLARAFEQLGVREGSFVTIALPNCIAFVESTIAALKLGATPQPVSGKLPKGELAAIVELAKPSLLVGANASDFPNVACIGANFVADVGLSDAALPDRISQYWKAPTSGGSTGRPKLIVSTAPAVVDENAQAFAMPFLLPRDGGVLVPGPLYHNGPFTFCLQGLLRGNHIVVMSKFDSIQLLTLIEQHRLQVMLLVPTMMSRISKLPEAERNKFDVSSLRVAYHMASHCPEWLKKTWIDWLGADSIYELYGGTEMQAVTIIKGSEWLTHPGSVGRCVIGEMKIIGEDGQELGCDEVGEIYMRQPAGAAMPYFYIGAEAKNVDGWETLGDLGRFDKDGYLYLADRRTDMILRGGANVYPAEVEAAIDEHPEVQSSAVIGLPDDDLGQRIHAIVQAKRVISAEELSEHLAGRLAPYKRPASFEFVDVSLRDDAGKSRRSALRVARMSPAVAALSGA